MAPIGRKLVSHGDRIAHAHGFCSKNGLAGNQPGRMGLPYLSHFFGCGRPHYNVIGGQYRFGDR